MRAATLTQPRRFEVGALDLPDPGEGEVRIRVRGCGVCGSDMGPWKGLQGLAYPMPAGAPGHEVFGTVETLGRGVDNLAPGQERLGADEVLTYDDDVYGRVDAASGGQKADVVFEATGQQKPLELAAELTRVRGRLIIAGYHQDGPRSVDMQLWNWRGLDVINAHERDPRIYRGGMEEGVRLLSLPETGGLDLAPLITHTFPLAEINRAFAIAEERPAGFLKSLVMAEGAA